MRPDRYTFLAHRNLPFMNPLGEATWAKVIDWLNLPAGAMVVDFGSGWCELPLRLIERYRVHADCVELSPLMAGVARQRAQQRVPQELIRIHEGDAGAFKATIPAGAFDLTICIGSAHALGGLEVAIPTLTRLTRPGGRVLLATSIWEREPAPAYLEAVGMDERECLSHADTVLACGALGLAPELCLTATQREWDEYEWTHHAALESWIREHPDDPDAADVIHRSRAWRAAYLAHGRGTLGFGLYLLRRPL